MKLTFHFVSSVLGLATHGDFHFDKEDEREEKNPFKLKIHLIHL